jgi:hypothetical protein
VGAIRGGDTRPDDQGAALAGHVRHGAGGGARLRPRRAVDEGRAPPTTTRLSTRSSSPPRTPTTRRLLRQWRALLAHWLILLSSHSGECATMPPVAVVGRADGSLLDAGGHDFLIPTSADDNSGYLSSVAPESCLRPRSSAAVLRRGRLRDDGGPRPGGRGRPGARRWSQGSSDAYSPFSFLSH